MLDLDKIRIVEVKDVREESKRVKTLIFEDDLSSNANPGQFLMVWTLDKGELPMSVMIAEDDYAAISVKSIGEASSILYSKEKGDLIGIRGPYGNGFTVKEGKVLLIGGGTGLVPLLRLCKSTNANITLIMGAKNKDEVIFEDIASSLVERLIITTDDGSYGIKGVATDPLEELLMNERFDMIYTCGPELMMKKVLELADKYGIEAEASLERIMKCGIGLCSSCCLGSYILCKDGPVLNSSSILNLKEFGRYYRDKSGRLKSW